MMGRCGAFCAPPALQVDLSQRRSHSSTHTSQRQLPYCCENWPGRTRAPQRDQPPVFEQKTAQKLSRDLLAAGVLQEEDVKLFETFTESRAQLFLRVLNSRTRHITFVLDGVHGAHNLAAIARSCDAWGVQNLHLIGESYESERDGEKSGMEGKYASLTDRFEREKSVQKVSKNSHKWLTIKEHDGVSSCLQELKSSGYKVLVSSLSPIATPIQEVDVSTKCAFVFGNEQRGVSKEMEAQADGLFTIPMMGFVESMNVSVAVATTASLTITKGQTIVPQTNYKLSTDEKRELAHVWIRNRFSANGSPRMLPSSQDVTRLGPQCERRILEEGMFEHSADALFDPRNPQMSAVRLSADAGARLANYVSRRKFGALGDGRFDKRCNTITYCLAGAHTLSSRAALGSYESELIARPKLFKYFTEVCNGITDMYAPYFDNSGIPILPTFAPESHQTFDELSTMATHEALRVCLEVAQDHFALEASVVYAIIESASYRDLSRCVTDTLGWSREHSEIFQAEVMTSLAKVPDLMHTLQERETVRKLTSSFNLESMSGKRGSDVLPDESLAALQVFLRLSHAAFLSSELHQAVWDRSTTKSHLARVHSLRFGLLESILCEAWAESCTLPSLVNMGPLRLVLEWDQALTPLKVAVTHSELRNNNESLSPKGGLEIKRVTEVANAG